MANLDLRDAGTWVCEIGSSTKESFQVQTKEFVIDIESKMIFIFRLFKRFFLKHTFCGHGNANNNKLIKTIKTDNLGKGQNHQMIKKKR